MPLLCLFVDNNNFAITADGTEQTAHRYKLAVLIASHRHKASTPRPLPSNFANKTCYSFRLRLDASRFFAPAIAVAPVCDLRGERFFDRARWEEHIWVVGYERTNHEQLGLEAPWNGKSS